MGNFRAPSLDTATEGGAALPLLRRRRFRSSLSALLNVSESQDLWGETGSGASLGVVSPRMPESRPGLPPSVGGPTSVPQFPRCTRAPESQNSLPWPGFQGLPCLATNALSKPAHALVVLCSLKGTFHNPCLCPGGPLAGTATIPPIICRSYGLRPLAPTLPRAHSSHISQPGWIVLIIASQFMF